MGIIISESAAKKLTSYKVEEQFVSINKNDILINYYGDNEHYASFPKIGEYVKNRILCSVRRFNRERALFDMTDSELRRLDAENDEIIYSHNGQIVDIDVFLNSPIDQLSKDAYMADIVDVCQESIDYYTKVKEFLSRIVNNPECKYSAELSRLYREAVETLDPDVKWRYDTKAFEQLMLKFTILTECPAEVGDKLTGRYGNLYTFIYKVTQIF